MTITVAKIGSGTDTDPIRPDTAYTDWILVSETKTEMTIEIINAE